MNTASPTSITFTPPVARPHRDPGREVHARRSRGGDVRAVGPMLRSEWRKLTTVRSNKVILAFTIAVNLIAAWAVAALVTDEVLTATKVSVFPALLSAVLAAVAGILLFTAEAQHGTLAATVTAQPTRWVIALAKLLTAAAVGLVLGAVGMVAAFGGALLGGLEPGDTAAMAATAGWALWFTMLAAVIGLGIGMVVRHGAGAISGLLVWWFVVENMVVAFAPATVSRLLPFDAGYRLLEVGSDFDTPAILAAAFARPQLALVFSAYAVVAMAAGTILLYRRDPS